MTQEKKIFEPLSKKEREDVEEILCMAIEEHHRRDKIEDNFYKYDVTLQNIKFITTMTDEEVKESARLVVDVLEELKSINNGGIDKEALMKLEDEASEKYSEKRVIAMLDAVKRFETEKLSKIISEIGKVRRVGGAWEMLVAAPGLRNGICVVFNRIVDQFDDEDIYLQCGYFLLRAVMHMNCTEYD